MALEYSMHEQTLSLTGQDSHGITGTVFCPDTPHSVLVIAHGMAEHAGRYADFARWLAEHDIAVVTFNHRGHGPACPTDQLGHYSDTDGWGKVVDDLNRPQLWAFGALIDGIRRLYGSHHRSPTIARMTFGKFNLLFRPNRTDCDWLSRDAGQVDQYVADPLCAVRMHHKAVA